MIILTEDTGQDTRETEYRTAAAAVAEAKEGRENFPEGQSTLTVWRVNRRARRWTCLFHC